VPPNYDYRDTTLMANLRTTNTVETLFADSASSSQAWMAGQYQLRINSSFVEAANLDALLLIGCK
jgi:hypothetical protein